MRNDSHFCYQVAQKWEDMIATDEKQTTVVSIPRWVSRATLDAIGEGKWRPQPIQVGLQLILSTAAFDYQFGAVDDSGNALAESYNNMLCVDSVVTRTFLTPS